MDMLCLVPPELSRCRDLVAAVTCGNKFRQVEIVQSPGELSARLGGKFPVPCLLLFAADSFEHLEQMLELRQDFLDMPLILLVNHLPPEMLVFAQRLHPHLLAPLDTDGEELTEVLANLFDRMPRPVTARPQPVPERPGLH